MLVSVITPTYQRAHLLAGAISSVLAQQSVELELVVVDDGSTDGTRELVTGIDDARVRYIRFERNQGSGAARQAGVREARGEIVAFLDSDDVWRRDKLSMVSAAFGRYPDLDLVFSDYENINHIDGSRRRGFEQTAGALSQLEKRSLEPGWWKIEARIPEALLQANFIGTCSIAVLRRRVFERLGSFRPELRGAQDLEMWWRAALGGMGFGYTDAVLVERHKTTDSITADARTYAPRYLKALVACEETARALDRLDLLPHLRDARARAWCSAIEACGSAGERREALGVFLRSLPQGVSWATTRELLGALTGPRARSFYRRFRGARPA
jgi:glycosyltransferase involved in cell wall biosynthesis